MPIDDDYDIFEDEDNQENHEINAWQVHITEPLTSEKIIELMDKYPSLRRITCSQSLYTRISPKYLKVLDSLDINVEIEYNWGRKQLYSNEDINQVLNLLDEGKSPKDVSEQLQIPLKRVYYFRSKYSTEAKNDFHKKKYDDKIRQEVNYQRNNGLTPEEISKNLNIPIRSIYYILNKK